MKYTKEYGQELEELIIKTSRNKTVLHEFLLDLLSPAEYKELAVRWQIMMQLEQGVSHREIAKNLMVGVGTITRGSRELANKKGGFRIVLDKYFPSLKKK